MKNPDKEIRKYFFDTLTGEGLAVYDTRAGLDNENQYIILSTQSKVLEEGNKCGSNWNSTTNIEIVEYLPKDGNQGSRVWLNDTEEKITQAYKDVDYFDNFAITTRGYNSTDLVTYGTNELIKRTIITINFKLYENEHNTD
jgi:hypothetical protein